MYRFRLENLEIQKIVSHCELSGDTLSTTKETLLSWFPSNQFSNDTKKHWHSAIDDDVPDVQVVLDGHRLSLHVNTEKLTQKNKNRNEVSQSLDVEILKDASRLINNKEKVQLTYNIKNTQRAIGAYLSSTITRKFGMHFVSNNNILFQRFFGHR